MLILESRARCRNIEQSQCEQSRSTTGPARLGGLGIPEVHDGDWGASVEWGWLGWSVDGAWCGWGERVCNCTINILSGNITVIVSETTSEILVRSIVKLNSWAAGTVDGNHWKYVQYSYFATANSELMLAISNWR